MIDEHASLTEEAKQQMLASVGDDDFFEPSVEYPAKVRTPRGTPSNIQVYQNSHVPQKPTVLISLYTNPASISSAPVQTRPFKPLTPSSAYGRVCFNGSEVSF